MGSRHVFRPGFKNTSNTKFSLVKYGGHNLNIIKMKLKYLEIFLQIRVSYYLHVLSLTHPPFFSFPFSCSLGMAEEKRSAVTLAK